MSTTFLAQNQFISNSAAHVPVASGSAGAAPCPQPRAPAAQIQACGSRGHVSALDTSLAGTLAQDRPATIQSSDGELPDSPIDSHGLTDADCKWPLSLLEGETTRQIIKPSGTEAAACTTVAASDKITDPPSNEGRPSEAPASAPTKNPDAGALGTEHIHELFFYARKLSAEARWFVPDYPDIYQAMLDPGAPRALETDPVWADEPPLFLQKREA